jgi:hypothetical protein
MREGTLDLETQVEVRNQLDWRWSSGFVVAGIDAGRYRLRRLSDGAVLPVLFGEDSLRPRQP